MKRCAAFVAVAFLLVLSRSCAQKALDRAAHKAGDAPPAGAIRVNPRDGAAMVYVPAGEFLMGSNDTDTGIVAMAQRRVFLDGFWMYKHEVTVAQYRRFCSETECKMPPAPSWGWKDDHPVVNASWHDADAYAGWAGVSLPTEAQWEKAARGTDGRKWPWGNVFDVSRCVCSVPPRKENSTARVGSAPRGASPYGCLDMAGNVWEWCADWHTPGDNAYANDRDVISCSRGGFWDMADRAREWCVDRLAVRYSEPPARNPTGPTSGSHRVIHGGARYDTWANGLRSARRPALAPNKRNENVGLRCSSVR